MSNSESLLAVDNSGVNLETTYEMRHGSLEMMKVVAPGLGVRLESFGSRSIRYFWPTEVRKADVMDLILSAGQLINATSYGYAHCRGATWTKLDKPTSGFDAQSAEFHKSTMARLLGGYVASELLFEGLAAANGQHNTFVWWMQAFNDGDSAVGQLSIEGNHPGVNITDDWVVTLIEATTPNALSISIIAATKAIQGCFEQEATILALRNVQFGLP